MSAHADNQQKSLEGRAGITSAAKLLDDDRWLALATQVLQMKAEHDTGMASVKEYRDAALSLRDSVTRHAASTEMLTKKVDELCGMEKRLSNVEAKTESHDKVINTAQDRGWKIAAAVGTAALVVIGWGAARLWNKLMLALGLPDLRIGA